MSKPDERLVEGVDYDHGDYEAVGEDEFTGYGDLDPASLYPEPDEPDWDSPHFDGNDGSHGSHGEAIG